MLLFCLVFLFVTLLVIYFLKPKNELPFDIPNDILELQKLLESKVDSEEIYSISSSCSYSSEPDVLRRIILTSDMTKELDPDFAYMILNTSTIYLNSDSESKAIVYKLDGKWCRLFGFESSDYSRIIEWHFRLIDKNENTEDIKNDIENRLMLEVSMYDSDSSDSSESESEIFSSSEENIELKKMK